MLLLSKVLLLSQVLLLGCLVLLGCSMLLSQLIRRMRRRLGNTTGWMWLLYMSWLLLELGGVRLVLTLEVLCWHTLLTYVVAGNTLVLGPLRWHVLVLRQLPLLHVWRRHGATTMVLLVRRVLLVWVLIHMLLLVLAQVVLRVHWLILQALPTLISFKVPSVRHVQELLVTEKAIFV